MGQLKHLDVAKAAVSHGKGNLGATASLTKMSFPKALASTQKDQGPLPAQMSGSELGRATAFSSLTSIQSPLGGSWLPDLGTELRVLDSQSTHVLTAVSLPPQDEPRPNLLGVTHHPTLLPYPIHDEL